MYGVNPRKVSSYSRLCQPESGGTLTMDAKKFNPEGLEREILAMSELLANLAHVMWSPRTAVHHSSYEIIYSPFS